MNKQQESFGQQAIRIGLTLYKHILSPMVHAVGGTTGACRFQPTCSEYAGLAWHVHGPVRGAWLTAWRLMRCQPFGRGGFDPVPEALQVEGASNNPPGSI